MDEVHRISDYWLFLAAAMKALLLRDITRAFLAILKYSYMNWRLGLPLPTFPSSSLNLSSPVTHLAQRQWLAQWHCLAQGQTSVAGLYFDQWPSAGCHTAHSRVPECSSCKAPSKAAPGCTSHFSSSSEKTLQFDLIAMLTYNSVFILDACQLTCNRLAKRISSKQHEMQCNKESNLSAASILEFISTPLAWKQLHQCRRITAP